MSDADARLRFSELLRGLVQAVPTAPRALGGLWTLATLKPTSRASLGAVVERWARERPEAPALEFNGKVLSYRALDVASNRLANRLRREGVRPGQSVAVLMENRAEAMVAVLGIVKLGAAAALLNHQQRGEVLRHSLSLVDPVQAIVGRECEAAWQSAGSSLAPIWDDPAGGPETLAAATVRESARRPPELDAIEARSTCFYIFTSGTTGLPKASRMTHYRWLRGMAGLGGMALRLAPEDRLYCCLPVYHNNALTVSWGAVLSAGATLVLARKFSARAFWEEIRASRATAFCYIGELCRYLLNQPPSERDRDHAVHSIVGNGLRPELWEAFQTRFGIERVLEFYGASESNLAFVNGFNVKRTAGFCPLPFAVVAFDAEAEQPIRDAKGRMRRVATGEVGLLISEVTERAPFDGYTDPDASEAKLLRDVFKPGDCWFNTGDLVRDQGFRHIQFVDRVGDTFRWKGENVATSEVEAVLARFPGVEQAVVYGVSIPGMDGRAGMAAITPRGPFDPDALHRFLVEALPPYAVPLFLRLREEQATTATFKYRKVELKREGFDPAVVREPLYVRWSPDEGYRRLDARTHAAIIAGDWRG